MDGEGEGWYRLIYTARQNVLKRLKQAHILSLQQGTEYLIICRLNGPGLLMTIFLDAHQQRLYSGGERALQAAIRLRTRNTHTRTSNVLAATIIHAP